MSRVFQDSQDLVNQHWKWLHSVRLKFKEKSMCWVGRVLTRRKEIKDEKPQNSSCIICPSPHLLFLSFNFLSPSLYTHQGAFHASLLDAIKT